MAAIKAEIKEISAILRKARKEADYCADIEGRSVQVQKNLTEQINECHGKEVHLNEHTVRSGRSSREDHAGRQ